MIAEFVDFCYNSKIILIKLNSMLKEVFSLATNAVRINEIDTRLRTLRINLDNEIAARNRVRNRLEDLRRANLRLDNLLDRYFSFPDEYCDLHAPLDPANFHGSRREAIEGRLDSIRESLKTQRSRHEDHSRTIKNRVTADERLENQHSGTISSINSQISNLEAERRRLLLQ